MAEQPEKPDYADSMEAQLVADYVSGGMTFAEVARTLGFHRSTIYDRMDASPRFREMMERARERGYDAIADECVQIAEDSSEDTIETRWGPKLNKEFVQRSKLRIETRLKLLAAWHPKKYGQKVEIDQRSQTIIMPASDDPIEAQRAYEQFMKGG